MEETGFINHTPFAAEPLFLINGKGEDVLTVLAQATFRIEGRDRLVRAEVQRPIAMGGEWHGEPGKSSCKLEPQIAPAKASTDVALVGHAYAASRGDVRVDVGLLVGPVRKVVRVSGDRFWLKSFGELISAPAPFEKIPLVYERAFGGWDRRHKDESRHRCERRNPLGTGYFLSRPEEGTKLPNLEDPAHPIRNSSDTPPPAGFGFVGPDWLPRARLAGTYDEKWMENRMPLLPEDFHPRFYNSAHPDLIAPGHLRGDERVAVIGASPRGRLELRLPGLPPPAMRFSTRAARENPIRADLDTVVVDTDAHEVLLLWRGCASLPAGLRSLAEITVLEGAK